MAVENKHSQNELLHKVKEKWEDLFKPVIALKINYSEELETDNKFIFLTGRPSVFTLFNNETLILHTFRNVDINEKCSTFNVSNDNNELWYYEKKFKDGSSLIFHCPKGKNYICNIFSSMCNFSDKQLKNLFVISINGSSKNDSHAMSYLFSHFKCKKSFAELP